METITLPTRLPPMKTQLQKLIQHINQPLLHNSESLGRQTKKEFKYWMANSFQARNRKRKEVQKRLNFSSDNVTDSTIFEIQQNEV